MVSLKSGFTRLFYGSRWNNYIVAKRGATETEYFVLKIVDSGVWSEAEKNIKGPMTEVEYKETLRELGLLEVIWIEKFEK